MTATSMRWLEWNRDSNCSRAEVGALYRPRFFGHSNRGQYILQAAAVEVRPFSDGFNDALTRTLDAPLLFVSEDFS